jgi:hypothetical protein
MTPLNETQKAPPVKPDPTPAPTPPPPPPPAPSYADLIVADEMGSESDISGDKAHQRALLEKEIAESQNLLKQAQALFDQISKDFLSNNVGKNTLDNQEADNLIALKKEAARHNCLEIAG